MKYSIAVSVAPPAEPLSLAETKLHLKRDDITTDDTLISALIQAAREWVENYCRRSLVRRTLQLRMDCFPSALKLPRGPVASVSSIEYVDSGGNTQTLAASQYQVDTYSVPPRIVPPLGVVWPVTKIGQINAVTVTYLAGYDPSDDSPTDYGANVPAAIKAALKLLVGGWYANREHIVAAPPAEVPMAVKALLAPYEIRDFSLE